MKVQQGSHAEILRANLDVIESLIDCMELVVQALREKGMATEANQFIETIRHQRLQSMLVRGQLATW